MNRLCYENFERADSRKRSELSLLEAEIAYTTDDAAANREEFVNETYNQISDGIIDDYYGDPADVNLDSLYDDIACYFGAWLAANVDNVYVDGEEAMKDFRNFCYRRMDGLDESEGVQTSAEFQRMAPASKKKLIIQTGRKSLGKKDKYNTLGERKNEAYTGDRPKLSQTAYRDGYLAAKEDKDFIADNPY